MAHDESDFLPDPHSVCYEIAALLHLDNACVSWEARVRDLPLVIEAVPADELTVYAATLPVRCQWVFRVKASLHMQQRGEAAGYLRIEGGRYTATPLSDALQERVALPWGIEINLDTAYSDEAGHAFRSEAGHFLGLSLGRSDGWIALG